MFAVKKILPMLMALNLFLSNTAVVLAQNTANVVGNDTIAGEETILKASNFPPNQLVNFVVEKADGLNINMSVKADASGRAVAYLDGYHTQKAGIYYVMAENSIRHGFTNKTSFMVFPAAVDAFNSTLEYGRTVIQADGQDSFEMKVVLRDAYNNLLDGHAVKLISSRKADEIKPATIDTDKNGEADFTVRSRAAGLSYLSLMDVGEDVLLDARPTVSFVDDVILTADIGGDVIQRAHAQDAGALAGFEILDVPNTIKPNENVSFKVRAVDSKNVKVSDYTGTVRFSAEGENSSGVTLPANYKFLATDQGEHQFNLGLSFAKAGTYKIVVNDLLDKFKKAEKTVVVGDGGAVVAAPAGSVKPMITAPVPGTYSQAEQTVTGTGKTSSTMKIFDNSQEIGSVPVGPNGKFTFQTPALTDGAHSLYVTNVDTITAAIVGTSEPVSVNIDTKAPLLEDLVLEPSTGIKAGSVINVKVYSEKSLAQAAVLFNFDIIKLTASIDDPSVYVGTIQAPADAGAYSLSVLLVDELQNEKTYEAAAKITVDSAGAVIDNSVKGPVANAGSTGATPTNGGELQPVAGAPSQVNGLIGYGSDKRVTLVWNAATDDKMVKNYKVYYGSDVKSLSQVVLTKDASTTWYVPGLENGKEYFFAVTAIDDEGKESSLRSEIISSIPFALEINTALTDFPVQPLDNGLRPAAYSGPFPDNTAKTGPELLLVFGASAALGAVWTTKKKVRRKL